MNRLTSTRSFLLFCLVLALAKLILVAPGEIISMQDDSAVYASQSINRLTLGYPEGYPLWLSFCRIFEVPQRLAIEVLFLLSCVAFASAARKVLGHVAGYASFALLVCSSCTIFLFNLGLADGYYACLTLFALSFTLRIFERRERSYFLGWAIALGLTWGFMAITRNEDPLLALWAVCLVLGCGILWQTAGEPVLRLQFWRKPVEAAMVASVCASLVVVTLCTAYYVADGVFARAVALIPGHVRLLSNLARIQTGEPPTRFIPISLKARGAAYAVSPTFSKYRAAIENPTDGWQVISRENGIPPGEIGGGWIWHAINTHVIPMNGGKPALAEAEYQKMNREIETAFRDGRLKHRFVMHALLGGSPVHLISELPPSISAVLTSTFTAQPENTNDQQFEPRLFDQAFLRREALVPHPPELAVQGWAFINKPSHKIVSLTIRSSLGASTQLISQDRPDVVTAFGQQNGWKPTVIGFHADLKSRTPDDILITYHLDDGSDLANSHPVPHRVSKLENKTYAGDDIIQAIDEVRQENSPVETTRHKVEVFLFELGQNTTIRRLSILFVCCAILLASFAYTRTSFATGRYWLVFAGFLLISGAARVLFYSALDARAWPGNQIRYLVPVHEFWLILIAMAIGVIPTVSESFRRVSTPEGKAQSFTSLDDCSRLASMAARLSDSGR